MAGMLLFNPILGKKSVPVVLKMGLSLIFSYLMTPLIDKNAVVFSGMIDFMFKLLCELFIGFVMGFIMQLFISALLMAGEVMDLQLGFGMAKVYDPQSNVSMPLSGNLYNILYVLVFFAINGHRTLIKIIAESFKIVSPGADIVTQGISKEIVSLFGDMLVLALKLALPVLSIELLTEIGLGVLTRAVPQINVFVVGIQLKLFVGLIILALVIPSLTGVYDNAISYMFQTMTKVLNNMPAT